MQRAENVPDAFFRFTLETSLLRCSRQNRVQRVLAVRVTSPYTTRPPRGRSRSVQPSPPTRQILATGQQIILPFCAAAVPRDRQTGSRGISRSAHLYKLHFVSFVVRSATLKKPRNGGNFRDRMCNCITAHARLYDYHLVRAAPRHPANASRPAKNSAYRSPFPNSSNRKSRGPAPLAWVPIL